MSHTQSITATIATYDAVRDCIANKGALCILYATDAKVEKARVIVPDRIEVGKQSDLVRAWDSQRNAVVTFRIDRIAAFHRLPVKGVA